MVARALRLFWCLTAFGWLAVGADIVHSWWKSAPLDGTTTLCAVMGCVGVSISLLAGVL